MDLNLLIKIVSLLLCIFYLIRVANHISIRSSYAIAPIIIFPFLTSIYEKTFFSFLLNPSLHSFSLEGFKDLSNYWFKGSPAAMLLIGILFLAERISLPILGINLIIEILFITFGVTILLIKVYGLTQAWPIILGILVPVFIHLLKNKSLASIFRNYRARNNVLDLTNISISQLGISSGFVYFFISFLIRNENIYISPISPNHILRIVVFWSVFLTLLAYYKAFNLKVIVKFVPVVFMYSMFSLNTFFNVSNHPDNFSGYNLNCLSSISFLPLLEYIFILYQNLNIRIKYSNNIFFIKGIPFISKVLVSVLLACYSTYVLSH